MNSCFNSKEEEEKRSVHPGPMGSITSCVTELGVNFGAEAGRKKLQSVLGGATGFLFEVPTKLIKLDYFV